MKTKTQDLTGPALDWAVAEANGGVHKNDEGQYHDWSPSARWAQGGPIIEREGISVVRAEGGFYWQATHPDMYSDQQGDSPLIAAMRCFVASKMGDTVEIPEELQ